MLLDGTKVAVKVQRPGIAPKFIRDTQIMELMIRFILFFRIRPLYFMRDAVRELSTWTKDELDYRREASYCQMLGKNAVNTPTERVPKVYSELSSERVLTMEFLEGQSVSSYLRMLEQNDEARARRFARPGLRAVGFQLERDLQLPERRLPLRRIPRRPAPGESADPAEQRGGLRRFRHRRDSDARKRGASRSS